MQPGTFFKDKPWITYNKNLLNWAKVSVALSKNLLQCSCHVTPSKFCGFNGHKNKQ